MNNGVNAKTGGGLLDRVIKRKLHAFKAAQEELSRAPAKVSKRSWDSTRFTSLNCSSLLRPPASVTLRMPQSGEGAIEEGVCGLQKRQYSGPIPSALHPTAC